MVNCSRCILPDRYPGITFNEQGVCSLCQSGKRFIPAGEERLIALLNKVRKASGNYDVLVPLSGGKDSTYILHLAVNVYKLRVLAMTYDNGFFSQLALDNIHRAIAKSGVDHVFVEPDKAIREKVFRVMLTRSGDMCGACDIATKANILDVARKHEIPAVLYGNSPLENDSYLPDSIQDVVRCKYILRQSGELTSNEINRFLIFPRLNLFSLSIGKKRGNFPREISPLFFIENPSDQAMGDVITRELDWRGDDRRVFSKHFDCVAEPLTNYLRHKIYGYERRVCQYSNMVRRHEITREKAIDLQVADRVDEKPSNAEEVLRLLGIAPERLGAIESIPPLKYEGHTSKADRLFKRLMKIKGTRS